MSSKQKLYDLAVETGEALRRRGQIVATAESCTGGWIAKTLTDVPGSSAWFECGLVTYSDAMKSKLLAVSAQTLTAHGAVSEQTVREMATGVLQTSGADLAVAVSGVAGPDGGSDSKPVGTVWIAWARRDEGGVSVRAERDVFDGNRDAVRWATVVRALQGIRDGGDF